jgi:hypothetical protein
MPNPPSSKNVNFIPVKQLQITLKNALKKIEVFWIISKLWINSLDADGITRFQSNCKNTQLRIIHFKLIHNGLFSYLCQKEKV